jgi:hypothetical protein
VNQFSIKYVTYNGERIAAGYTDISYTEIAAEFKALQMMDNVKTVTISHRTLSGHPMIVIHEWTRSIDLRRRT